MLTAASLAVDGKLPGTASRPVGMLRPMSGSRTAAAALVLAVVAAAVAVAALIVGIVALRGVNISCYQLLRLSRTLCEFHSRSP